MTRINPLKWHGGKSYLADWILSHAPSDYTTYCEPYFGGGAVLFRHNPEGKSEVINDINHQLMNFWAVLRSPEFFAEFQRCLQTTPFAEAMFEGACNETFKNIAESSVNAAVRLFVRYRQSRQGLGKEFATLSKTRTRRGMNEQVASWLSAIESLPEAHARLKRVVILSSDALDVIRRLDGPDTWFYLDPPYVEEERVAKDCYEHEMSIEQHEDLLRLLRMIDGKFSLSGYPSELYNAVAEREGWHCFTREIDNKASSKKKKDKKIECLWTNFVP